MPNLSTTLSCSSAMKIPPRPSVPPIIISEWSLIMLINTICYLVIVYLLAFNQQGVSVHVELTWPACLAGLRQSHYTSISQVPSLNHVTHSHHGQFSHLDLKISSPQSYQVDDNIMSVETADTIIIIVSNSRHQPSNLNHGMIH